MKRTLVWKEIREQAAVTLLAGGIVSTILVYSFRVCLDRVSIVMANGYADGRNMQPLLSDTLLTPLGAWAAIFATLLGFLQIRAERHIDLLSFLIHRPMTRGAILLAKVAAGLGLYFAATVLPVVVFIGIVRRPGGVPAPFEPAMLLPLVAVLLVGLPYYFAGILVGVRKAHWYASRGLPLGVAIIAHLAAFAFVEFWQTLLMTISLAGMLATAAWGAYERIGHFGGQPFATKAAHALGFTLSSALLVAFLVVAVGSVFSGPLGVINSQYAIGRDGRVYKTSHSGKEIAVTDLQGMPMKDDAGKPMASRDATQRFALALSASFSDDSPRSGRGLYRAGYNNPARFFVCWRVVDGKLWYLVKDGALVAFDTETRLPVATVRPPASSGGDSQFVAPFHWSSSFRPLAESDILATRTAVYRVTPGQVELKPIFTVTNGDTIHGIAFETGAISTPASNHALILTKSFVRLIDLKGETKMQLSYEPAPPLYTQVGVFWLDEPNHFAVRFDPDYLENEKRNRTLPTEIKWVRPPGAVVRSETLPQLPAARVTDPRETLLLALAPPAIPVTIGGESYRARNYLRLVPAILSAVATFLLLRRFAASRVEQAAWSTFVFIFGVPGLIAFLALKEWPEREKCSFCGKWRVVTRDCCERCGAEFSAAKATGVEIFEPLTPTLQPAQATS